jgi:hypothetical protein
MVSCDMARVEHILVFTHTARAGAAARGLSSAILLTAGTLAFLTSAR